LNLSHSPAVIAS